jgi:hypothetical protein
VYPVVLQGKFVYLPLILKQHFQVLSFARHASNPLVDLFARKLFCARFSIALDVRAGDYQAIRSLNLLRELLFRPRQEARVAYHLSYRAAKAQKDDLSDIFYFLIADSTVQFLFRHFSL